MAHSPHTDDKKSIALELANLPPLRECDTEKAEPTTGPQQEDERLITPDSMEELQGEYGYIVYKIKDEKDWHIGIIDYITPSHKKCYFIDAAIRGREHRMFSISDTDLSKHLFTYRAAEKQDLKGLKLPSKNGEAFGRAALERRN